VYIYCECQGRLYGWMKVVDNNACMNEKCSCCSCAAGDHLILTPPRGLNQKGTKGQLA